MDYDICHGILSLRKLVCLTLTYFLMIRFEIRPFQRGKRPFKCDELKCDECDFCNKTNLQLTRRKRARHLKVVLPDSVPFVEVLHSVALPLREMLRCLSSNSLYPLQNSKVDHNSIVKNLKTESHCISPYVGIWASLSCL